MEQKSPVRLHAGRNQNCRYRPEKPAETTTSRLTISRSQPKVMPSKEKQPGHSLVQPGRQIPL
jgi:hypothetical protein